MADRGRPLHEKLELLETLLGSQKKAAERLGFNVSTIRAWKTGKRQPDKKAIERINRVYGQQKKKITDETIAKLSRRQEAAAKKRRAVTGKPTIEAYRAWVDRQFPVSGDHNNLRIRNGLSFYATEFVAYPGTDDRRIRFVSPDKLVDVKRSGSRFLSNDPLGKTKGQKYAVIVGIYSTKYDAERGVVLDDDDAMDVVLYHNMPILTGIGQAWDLEQTLDFLEAKFFEVAKNIGKRKYNPKQFIGFK